MAFTATDRVRVTSEASSSRGLYGTVKVAAADSDSGYNEVQIDGHQDGKVTLLADRELMSSTQPNPFA